MRAVARAAALLVLVLLAGCASRAGIEPVATPIDAHVLGARDGALSDAQWPHERWWAGYRAPGLDALIARALQDNPSLEVSKFRLARAHSAAQVFDAARLPQVSGSLGSTRQRYSEHDLFPPPIAGGVFTSNALRLDAAWELDFFGRNRAALDAALGQARAAEADLQAARVLLASEVARVYFQLARIVALHALAGETLRQRSQLRELVSQRVAAGLDTTVELRQAEAAVAEAAGQVEVLHEQAVLARNALAALSLQPADALSGLSPALPARALPVSRAPISVDLLGRRADIVAARWRIEAALRDRDVVASEFYPNVDLTAFIGFSSLGFTHWLESGSRVWGVGPALRLPVFDAGRLRARLRGKTADLDAAVASYNAAVGDAVREVGDQLASLRSIERQAARQQEARAAAESAYALARQRYRAGLANYLSVLSSEADVLGQRRATIELAARDVDLELALVRALGGGYRQGSGNRTESVDER